MQLVSLNAVAMAASIADAIEHMQWMRIEAGWISNFCGATYLLDIERCQLTINGSLGLERHSFEGMEDLFSMVVEVVSNASA